MLPADAQGRKDTPMATGVLDYFPDALAEVARVSRAGNDQHNPGQPLHWAREKSTDHADCIMRHLSERGTLDTDGQRHSAKVAWRALALLQTELEAEDGHGSETAPLEGSGVDSKEAVPFTVLSYVDPKAGGKAFPQRSAVYNTPRFSLGGPLQGL